MKIIVTHTSPDWDAITSVWLIKRFLPNWADAQVFFVPAGTKKNYELPITNYENGSPIERVGNDEFIHVDTGLGPLDHHQTESDKVCAASLTWDYVRKIQNTQREEQHAEDTDKWEVKKRAISRIVQVVVDIDHFKEVFWDNPTADYHEFSILNILDGLKLFKPDQDQIYMDFGIECLDALLHGFENKIWAEKEITEHGIAFKTRFGKALGFETLNDTVLKLAQKMGYFLVVRKDPRKGYVRIKARPPIKNQNSKIPPFRRAGKSQPRFNRGQKLAEDIDLTPTYEKLKELDPDATWFLHVSKRMLLNGTTKNPKMRPTKLGLSDIIEVLKEI